MFIMCIGYYQADPYYSNMMYNPPDVCWHMLNHIMSQYYLHYLGIFKLKGLEYKLATSSKPFTIRKTAQEPPTHPELLPWEHEKEEPIYPDENSINYIRGAQYVYTKGTNRF